MPNLPSLFRCAILAWMWLLLAGVQAQPDLARWAMMVGEFEAQHWVGELEGIEPGCVMAPLQPELRVQDWPARSPWAESLVAELDALPEAEHHADRALQRLLADGMRLFRLAQANGDRSRPEMEAALTEAGLPAEWAVLPFVLTGWDQGYYGPGRRAGAWAMDLPTALSLGLQVRRGWDERHLPERMGPAMVVRIAAASNRFPDSPLLQVLDVVRGPRSAERFDPDFLDADLLGWLHLLRVWLQVDRNFKRDRLTALWALRERQWTAVGCAPDCASSHFQALGEWNVDVRMVRRENPWYTTDSIGWTSDRPGLRLPKSVATDMGDAAWSDWCLWTPTTDRPHLEHVHVVQPGEVLGTIARRHGVRISEIQEWNGLNGDLIRAGQSLVLRIPRPKPEATTTQQSGVSTGTFRWHTVREGESFWSISTQYPGISMGQIMSANDLAPEALQPGMQIRIPQE